MGEDARPKEGPLQPDEKEVLQAGGFDTRKPSLPVALYVEVRGVLGRVTEAAETAGGHSPEEPIF